MSDISASGGRLGLPAFVFVANEGPPPLSRRLAAWLAPPHLAAPAAPQPTPSSTVEPAEVRSPETLCAPAAPPQTVTIVAQTVAVAPPRVAAPRREPRPLRPRIAAGYRAIKARCIARYVALRALAAGLSPIWRATRATARFTLAALRWLAPRLWNIFRRWPATSIGLTGGAAMTAFALIPILSEAPIGLTSAEAGTPAPQGWINIIRPARIYALEMPDLGPEPRLYEASRYRGGDGRRDVMTFGSFGAEDRPWLRLQVYRPGAEAAAEPSLAEAASRHAAQAGLAIVSRAEASTTPTRFGAMRKLPLQISSEGDAAGELACLAFQIVVPAPALQIDGIACESPERRVDESALACMVDRLDLQSFGDDLPLGKFFAKVEKGRKRDCGKPGAGRSPLTPISRSARGAR